MKKLFIIAVSAVLAFTACGGSDPSGVTDQSGDLFISVDKTVVESDGKDIAVFTIKDASGKVITVVSVKSGNALAAGTVVSVPHA